MQQALWGIWLRTRLVAAKGQRWFFAVGKWLALGFIVIYVLGFMAGLTLEALGYPELGRPIINAIGAVNEIMRQIVTNSR